jgi:hypothetical protein
MGTLLQPGQRQYMRLRKVFLDAFPWNHKKLTREGFRRWARTLRTPPINFPIQQWRPLHEGEPVPIDRVAVFCEYIGDIVGIWPKHECLLSKIAVDCGPPDRSLVKSRLRKIDAWTSGWQKLLVQVLDKYPLDDLAYCADESDLALASRMIFECLGWHDKRLTGKSAVAYAVEVMHRTPEAYADTLALFWKTNEHAVLFATERQGDLTRRISVNVCVPVTEDFYWRFHRGEACESRITSDDLLPQSRYVFFTAVAENCSIDLKRNKIGRSLAHSRSSLYQLAALLMPVQQEDCSPHIITFAGSKENAKRLRAYNFEPTGAKTVSNGHDIMTFARPDRSKLTPFAYLHAMGEYLPMKAMIQLYQIYIDSQNFSYE